MPEHLTRTLFILGFAAGIASLAGGCSLSSKVSLQDQQAQQVQQVHETEPGTYSINVIQSHGFGAASRQEKAMTDAIGKAGDYCHAKEQKLLIVPTASQTFITFHCVAEETR